MMKSALVAVLLAATLGLACATRAVVVTQPAPVSASQMAELRVDPATGPRELFWGVGGERYAPAPKATYTFKAKDETGFSVSYDVIDPDGLEWSAKIGPEAQTEVVVSRILWGLGYHQPPVYYLPSWQLVGEGEPKMASEARFRPKLPQLTRLPDVFSFADNPFSGTPEFKGLLVVLLMLNSTDIKDSNNSIYEVSEPWDGARRWFVVRDIGAALGETGILAPTRNSVEEFEKESFITKVADGKIEFDYNGRHQELLAMIDPADLQWAATQMARLTDAQWRDAFRAANYDETETARFLARIKEKMADAMALRVDRRETN